LFDVRTKASTPKLEFVVTEKLEVCCTTGQKAKYHDPHLAVKTFVLPFLLLVTDDKTHYSR
jgi:hypothetical protein